MPTSSTRPLRWSRLLLAATALLVAACTATTTGGPTATGDRGVVAPTTAAFPATLERAEGQVVRWWLFGGDDRVNTYIDDHVVPAAAELGVTLEGVPIADTADAVQRVVAEVRAGEEAGSVDLIWINGENFAAGKEAGLWLRDWARDLPNTALVDDTTVATDFNRAGAPVVADHHDPARPRPGGAGRDPHHGGRAVGRGQDHPASGDRRARPGVERGDHARWGGPGHPTGASARPRGGVPGAAPIPVHERPRQRRVTAAHGRGRPAGPPPAARDLLEEVGLAGTGRRGVKGLSGGEAQRVALARALAGDPELLLLDEPLSAVDPARRGDLRHLVARVQRDRGVTTLYVTHDRAEAAALGHRVALLVEGRVLQHACPQELFERPRSAVVARFFGASTLRPGPVVAGRLRRDGVDLPVTGPDRTTTVALRPEHLGLAAPHDALGRGVLAGVVRSRSYQGGHYRLVVEVGPDTVIADVTEPDPPAPGARVRLTVDPSHVWALPGYPDTSVTP